MDIVVLVLLVIPIMLLVLGGWVGWALRGARMRRNHRIHPRHVPPPDEIYQQGFLAGRADALQDVAEGRVGGDAGSRVPGHSGIGERSGGGAFLPTAGGETVPTASPAGVVRSAPGGAGEGALPTPPAEGAAGAGLPTAADPVPSAEQIAAEKAARDLRNINVALYSASVLFVAAGGLFTLAAVPGVARAATISVVVALFYVGGLVLHSRLPRLRPAAVAFAGTGLALLPAAGLLFGVLTGQGSAAWFGTAVIGTAAYLLAAVRLNSRVVAFLALPFFLSVALSSVSLLGGALIWYFTCSIAVAAVLAVLLRFAPSLLPQLLARVVVETHRLLTPLALLASLALGSLLTDTDRAVLWGVAGTYYAGVLTLLTTHRIQHLSLLRIVGTVATAFTLTAAGVSGAWVVLVLTAAVALQLVVMLVRREQVVSFLGAGLDPGEGRSPGESPERAASLYRLDTVCSFWLASTGGLLSAALGWSSLVGLADPASRPDPLLPILLLLVLGMVCAVRAGGRWELSVLPGIALGLVPLGPEPWRTEVVLLLTAAYLVARAVGSSDAQRSRFVLGARAVATVLVPVVVLVHLPQAGPAGTGQLAALSFLVALTANVVVEVLPPHRDRAYREWILSVAAGVGLLVAVGLAGSADGGGLVRTGLWLAVAMGLAVTLSSVPSARARDGRPVTAPARSSGGGSRPRVMARVLEAAAPVSLVVVGLAGAPHWFGFRSYEALLALTVAHAALMAGRHRGRIRRGAYLLGAQLSFSALVAVISRDHGLSAHAVLVVLALTVAAQETVRVLLRRRLGDTGLQSSSAWLSIGALAVLPFVQLALPDAPRLDVVVVHLVLLAGVSILLFIVQRKDGAAYPVLYAAAALVAVLRGVLPTAGEGWLPEAPLTASTATLTALGAVAALTALRLRSGRRRVILPSRVGAVLFLTEATFLSVTGGTPWDQVLVAATTAAAAFAWSRREALAWLDAGGTVAVILAVTLWVTDIVASSVGRRPGDLVLLLLGAGIAAALLYLLRLVLPRGNAPVLRGRLLGATGLGWTAIVALLAMMPDTSAVAGASGLAVVAVLGVLEIPAGRRGPYGEGAFLVTALAVQRIAWLVLDGMDLFWAAQWWVVALAVLSGYSYLSTGRRMRGREAVGSAGLPGAIRHRGVIWLTGAALILSGSGLATVLGGSAGAQVWALCGHIALLVTGVALSRRSFSSWGAVGIFLALLWFLRGFTFILLAVAALLLLAFAIWKLNGQTRATPTEEPDREHAPGSHSPR